MSLITEALQLRKSAPRARGPSGQSFPPMRGGSPAAKITLLLALLCLAVVLAVWKGPWALEQIEGLAGRPPSESVPVPKLAEIPVPASAVPLAEPGAATPVPEKSPSETAATTVPGGPDGGGKTTPLPEELQPMDVNLSLALIEDEKARQQLDEENQRKIESFLRRMDVQGVCHQGADSTALLDTVLVRPGDPVGDLGLTLKAIEVRRLVFADRNGREHTKNY